MNSFDRIKPGHSVTYGPEPVTTGTVTRVTPSRFYVGDLEFRKSDGKMTGQHRFARQHSIDLE